MQTPLHFESSTESNPESGNVIFFILLAVVLVGLVTAAIRGGKETANIDDEQLLIKASQVRQYASELERGVAIILQKEEQGESYIRFAHPDAHADYGDINDTPEIQVFSERGGGASYRGAIPGISFSSSWEFYGNTHVPDVGANNPGDEKPELLAVLPDVTEAFCAVINKMNDQNAVPKEDGACDLNDTGLRFTSGTLYQDGAVNILDDDPVTSFTSKPALEACVQCGTDYHYYHVLIAR